MSDGLIPKKFTHRNKRYYKYDSEKYISVTSLLSLVKDDSVFRYAEANYYRNNPLSKEYTWKQYTRNIMNVGTLLHYRIASELCSDADMPLPEFDLKKRIAEYKRDDYFLMLSYWHDFKRICDPVVCNGGSERFVVNNEMRYSGTVDSVMYIDSERFMDQVAGFRHHFKFLDSKGRPKKGEIWLVDFKSSKDIYEGYEAQVQLYAMAWDMMFPEYKIDRMAILRMNMNGWEFYETNGDRHLIDKAIEKAIEGGYI